MVLTAPKSAVLGERAFKSVELSDGALELDELSAGRPKSAGFGRLEPEVCCAYATIVINGIDVEIFEKAGVEKKIIAIVNNTFHKCIKIPIKYNI